MFAAVENHDVERVKELLQCWFKVDCYKVIYSIVGLQLVDTR